MIRKQIPGSARYLPVLFILFLVVSSCSRKSDISEVVAPYQEKHDQAYGTDPLEQYDLYLPAGRGQQTKVILLIHGGGWVSGTKEGCDSYAKQFSGFGYAAVSMNYRLANDSVNYLKMLDDIDLMIGCISTHAGQWGIGCGHLSLFGYSAGGHLALLYSYSRNRNQVIRSVVSLAGPTDVQDSLLWETPGLLAEIKLMAGDTIPADWTQANPIHFAGSTIPSTLLIHGTYDSVVPVSQSLKLDHVLTGLHAPVKLLLLEKQTHYFTAGATETFLYDTKNFLDSTMR